MIFFYKLSIFFYSFAIRIAALFNPKAKLFVEGRKGLPLRVKAQMGNENRPRIWMHCASLGEFEQGRPVIESLREKYPHYAFVITFFSPSGYQVRKKYKGADYVFYLPLDISSNAQQFVRDINPALAIFVKYDLWFFYLSELKKRNIPTLLIDAIFRPQQGFFRWYGSIQRQMLQSITQIFVQNDNSKNLLSTLNITNVEIAGDTRFDRVLTVANKDNTIEEFEYLARKYKLLIAGSTWAEDEKLLNKILKQLPPDWKLIIVPHEVDESRISSVENLFDGNTKRWSTWQTLADFDKPVLIIDTIGLLLKIYRHGSLAWIGGGLGEHGVHNVLEAAVYGIPCAFGPVYHKYKEAVDLIENGGAVCCKNEKEFADFLSEMINNYSRFEERSTIARNYVQEQSGATSKIINYLEAKNWLTTL